MERRYSLLNKEGKWRERRDSNPRPPAEQGNNHNAQPGLAGRFHATGFPSHARLTAAGRLMSCALMLRLRTSKEKP